MSAAPCRDLRGPNRNGCATARPANRGALRKSFARCKLRDQSRGQDVGGTCVSRRARPRRTVQLCKGHRQFGVRPGGGDGCSQGSQFASSTCSFVSGCQFWCILRGASRSRSAHPRRAAAYLISVRAAVKRREPVKAAPACDLRSHRGRQVADPAQHRRQVLERGLAGAPRKLGLYEASPVNAVGRRIRPRAGCARHLR
jgi:hypothetical protein